MPSSWNHIIMRGTRMPWCQNERPVKYQGCNSHVGNVRDRFCLNHSVMVCSQCIQGNHTGCRTEKISDICNDLHSEDISNLKEALSLVSDNLVSAKSTLYSSFKEIEEKRDAFIKNVQERCDTVISKTQERCSELKAKVNKISNSNLSNLEEQRQTILDTSFWFDETIASIDKKLIDKIEPNLFLRIQEIIGKLEKCKSSLEILQVEKKLVIPFLISKEASTFISRDCQLVQVKEELLPLPILRPIPDIHFPMTQTDTASISKKHDISKISASKSGTLDSRLKEDTAECAIYGIDITNNGTLFLTDFNNKKLKVFSPEKEIPSTVPLPASPRDVSIVNGKTAVVSADDDNLYFINIPELDSLPNPKPVPLGFHAGGVQGHENNLIVTRFKDQTSVRMIDLEGNDIWSISADCNGEALFKNPFRLVKTSENDKASVIVTDCGKHSLILLDANSGQLIRTISVKGKHPHGLTVDNAGNLYVCYFSSYEIGVWSSDLQHSRILLSKNDLQGQPRLICYNGSSNTLYISYGNKDKLDSFQLEYK